VVLGLVLLPLALPLAVVMLGRRQTQRAWCAAVPTAKRRLVAVHPSV
jgi:hypothetical protein